MNDSKRDAHDRFEAAKRAVVDVGLFRRGSLVRRMMPCGKPGCRCQATPPELHGPYYQWTRKVRGKTVTVRLSASAAALMKQWIANGRALNKLIARMERLSTQVTEGMLRQLEKS
jgi:hypothetical protein